MSGYKEFQGKNLDEAIAAACDHFQVKRDKLEIEIIGGGSTGIFGLVGVKKATIKARPRAGVKTLDEIEEEPGEPEAKPAPEPKPAAEARPEQKPEARPERKPEPRPESKPEPRPERPAAEQKPAFDARPPAKVAEKEIARREPARTPARQDERPKAPAVVEQQPKAQALAEPLDEEPEGQPFEASAIDPVVLERTVREVTERLLLPIVQKPKITIAIEPDKVNVFVDDDEHSGLIIGREGQTLSALQYLVNRITARTLHTSVRVQIDTGEYRERQDDKLRQLAFHLAEKASTSGRIQSTKPLSSYHRRVVHLALQENEAVFTRSKGEGPMKRVLILPKRHKNSGNNRINEERA